ALCGAGISMIRTTLGSYTRLTAGWRASTRSARVSFSTQFARATFTHFPWHSLESTASPSAPGSFSPRKSHSARLHAEDLVFNIVKQLLLHCELAYHVGCK